MMIIDPTRSHRWQHAFARVRRIRPLHAGLLAFLFVRDALANPQGMSVAGGKVTATQNGAQLNIQASHNAVINWQSFNIKAGETTTFQQPSAVSVVWNRIFDANPSQIWGNLNANGHVVLMNQNGFYFGPNSQVLVGGLVVTTVQVPPESPAGGGMWTFNGSPPAASIINYGEVKAQSAGSVFLISERIENHGVISAPQGTVGLYGGKEVLISERPDGRGISANVRLPHGTIDNSGKVIADAGTIAMHAQVVNQNGLVQANSVRERNGTIELFASESVNLGPDSRLIAQGDSAGPSAGGSIVIRSEQTFADAVGSRIDVSGGVQGGNGGAVELSAPKMAAVNSHIDGTAQPGWKGGELFLDPTDIVLGTDGDGSTSSGTVSANDPPDTLRLNVNSAFAGFAQIHLEATRDISVDPYTTWFLNDSTGISDAGSLLTLEAGRNIVFGDNARIVGGAGWSVKLAAGVDFASANHDLKNGIGGIYLNGNPPDASAPSPIGSGAIETADGNIELRAGHEILVGGGFIRSIAGGNIDITTGDGNVDAGTRPDNYHFGSTGANLNSDLSGIGTANGGNVTIHSGHDMISFAATSGAYGPGNVAIIADNLIFGKYIVANGQGTLRAGTDVGSMSSPISLSLISGSWDVADARDIYLNEVLNPNGVFNSIAVRRVKFRFDYAPDAAVYLTARNSVQLLGNNLATSLDHANQNRPALYPGTLEIHAGAGGVVLGSDLVLAPSPVGRLEITTTDGGSLRSAPDHFYQLVMSDSLLASYRDLSITPANPADRDWATGHASTPIHLNDPEPVRFQIAGNVENIFLRMPKPTEITVGGNALNFTFEGQNLHGDDRTLLTIAGDYLSRSDRTFAFLPTDPDLTIFDPMFTTNPDLFAHLTYDPLTHKLGFQGKMTAADRDFLLHPLVRAYDRFGLPILDANSQPVLFPAVFTTDAAAINSLYTSSQDIPSSSLAYNGIQIGGPGSLAISAHHLDLGISRGIRSVGPLLNNSLASVSLQGANISLDLGGSLDMTSSQIASFNGGSISVSTGGDLNIGSQEQFTSDDTPKGIYTGHGGNVSVAAEGNINVNGSRIASYDGGDLTVLARTGDVDAGTGAKGFFIVSTAQLDPSTGKIGLRNDRFFGSGIVALTRPDSSAHVGNISVESGRDILANSGGILQLAFNRVDQSGASVMLDAARNIEANQSGVLGFNVDLKAGGDIKGLVVANNNINVDAKQNAALTALGGGAVSVKAEGTVSGSIVGGVNVDVKGADVTASVISTGGKASSNDSSAQANAFANVAAPVAQQTATDADKALATKATKPDDEEEKKKRGEKSPVLSKTTGRVTVILPNK